MSTQEVDLEDGWAALKILISKLIDRVEGGLKPYSGDEIIDAHRIIYKLCNQKLPHDNDEFLYNRYKTFLSDYFNETVLPSLKDKRNECLLKELTERWPKYLSMVECISCLFDYLDELITVTRSLPSLKIVGVTCFFSLVYTEIHATVKDAVLALIENDSHVLVANSALLKNCIDFFAKMKSVDTDRSYSWDLETALFSKRAEYHRKIASTYISTIEFPEYILMAEKYLNEEDGWASCFLKQSNYFALMKNLRQMWLRQCESEKLKSYFSSLVLNGRVEDLKRLYDLFGPHKGLDSIKLLFKQYVDETMATLRDDSNRDGGLLVIYDKHEMFSQIIEDCFGDNPDIQKVLNECLDYDDDTLSFTSVNRQPQVSDPTAASVSKPKGTESVTSS